MVQTGASFFSGMVFVLVFLNLNLKSNLMETSMTDRLLDCFAKAVREKKGFTEAELSSAYTEFMNRLQSITDGGQPVIVKLRQLRRLELELETYRHGAYPTLEGLTDIYLTKAAALVRMEADLLHFMADHPEIHAAPSPADEKTKRHPALHWKGSQVNLMELIASLDYSGLVTDGQGNRVLCRPGRGIRNPFQCHPAQALRLACRSRPEEKEPLRPASQTPGNLREKHRELRD